MIALTFEEWKNCIINDCKINLTQEFARKRLAILENSGHPETQKFTETYGDKHLDNIIYWFSKIKNDAK